MSKKIQPKHRTKAGHTHPWRYVSETKETRQPPTPLPNIPYRMIPR